MQVEKGNAAVPRLGEVLRHRGLLSAEDLARALDFQHVVSDPLGEIFVAHHGLHDQALHAALHDQGQVREKVHEAISSVPRLGELLVSQGTVAPDRLGEALAIQATTREHLGAILVRMGWIAVCDLVEALAHQHRLRNAAIAALLGVGLIVQPAALAFAGDMATSSSESVQVSVTISKRLTVDVPAGATSASAEAIAVGHASGSVPLIQVAPFQGSARVTVEGSGQGGALVATTADGQQVPYHVLLHDPASGRTVELGGAGAQSFDFTSLQNVPSHIEIAFDGLPAGADAAVEAGGILLVTVSPGV